MNFQIREVGTDLLIRVSEERIDAAAAVQFRDAMRDAADGGHPRIVLDLADVEFVDSSGLGAIIAAMKHVGPDRRLELAALRPAVARVFRLTRLDEVMTVHADADAAFDGRVPAE